MEKLTVQFLLCFLVQFAVITSANETPHAACGFNAQYVTDASGAVCEKTCQNPDIVCAESPLGWEGCKCDPEFVRNSKGECVYKLDERCRNENSQCGENEIMADQEDNCKNCEASCRVKIGTCGEECHNGCYCKSGYFRNKRGVCILEDQCNDILLNSDDSPQDDEEHEEYDEYDDASDDDDEIARLLRELFALLSKESDEEE